MPELIPGVAFALSPLVRRILAGDHGAPPGTNTYLVGIDEVAVIDPGPDDDGHLRAVVGCGGDRIRWVVVTHTHGPSGPGGAGGAHGAGAASLCDRTGAELVGPADLAEGAQLVGTEFSLTAHHTPGHAPDHVCLLFEEERMLFSGDHVSLLPAPDGGEGDPVIPGAGGDWEAWAAQLERLRAIRLRTIAPGHGELVEDPAAALDACLRRARAGPAPSA